MNGRNGIGGWKKKSKTPTITIPLKLSRELHDKLIDKLTDQSYGGFQGIPSIARNLLSEWVEKNKE